jgi:signal peptidase I
VRTRRRLVSLGTLGLVAVAAAVYLLARSALGTQRYYVGGDGMEPTVRSGDVLVVRPLERAPHRGEVVLVHPFGGSADTYVQRVVAGPGDTIEMTAGHLCVNGQEVREPYVRVPSADRADAGRLAWMVAHGPRGVLVRAFTPSDWGPLVVPAGHLFLLGDNRENDYDGRFIGFVRCEWIVGIPVRIDVSVGDDGFRWTRIGRFDAGAAREAWGSLWQGVACPGSS